MYAASDWRGNAIKTVIVTIRVGCIGITRHTRIFCTGGRAGIVPQERPGCGGQRPTTIWVKTGGKVAKGNDNHVRTGGQVVKQVITTRIGRVKIHKTTHIGVSIRIDIMPKFNAHIGNRGFRPIHNTVIVERACAIILEDTVTDAHWDEEAEVNRQITVKIRLPETSSGIGTVTRCGVEAYRRAGIAATSFARWRVDRGVA